MSRMNYINEHVSRKVLEWMLAAKHAGIFGEHLDSSSVMDMDMMIAAIDLAEQEDLLGDFTRDEALIMWGIMIGRFYQSQMMEDEYWTGAKILKEKMNNFWDGDLSE